MKGMGGSPVVDQMKEQTAVQTSLSFAELLANSKKMKEEMLGRPLEESELKELEEKIKKFYPNAK